MKAFAPIQEMITFVQFANDECDYGMGYELGIDLFCYGSHVRLAHTHTQIIQLRSNLKSLHKFIFVLLYNRAFSISFCCYLYLMYLDAEC